MLGYFGPFVVPVTLASPTDLATWTGGTAPANAVALLRSCTTLVLDATEGAYYPVDEVTGLATDTQTLNAMRDATCIQAAAWAELKINPLTGGIDVGGVKKSKKIGSASFDMAGAEQTAAARAYAVTHLVPEALMKLQQNNLLGVGPYTR
ncbi:MAG: hypothetical protein JWM23_547 [Microbacteriaceae bacterium]|nr:hypothetical protein [Microbacteriaceae bacterium]